MASLNRTKTKKVGKLLIVENFCGKNRFWWVNGGDVGPHQVYTGCKLVKWTLSAVQKCKYIFFWGGG